MYDHIIIIYHHTSSFTIILFWTCSIQHIISQWFSPMFFNFYMNFQWQARNEKPSQDAGQAQLLRAAGATRSSRCRTATAPQDDTKVRRGGGCCTMGIYNGWLVLWNIFPQFSPYIGNNHPNWLIFFQRGWNDQPDGKRMNMMKCSGFTCPTRDFDFGQVENLGKVGEVLKLEKNGWIVLSYGFLGTTSAMNRQGHQQEDVDFRQLRCGILIT